MGLNYHTLLSMAEIQQNTKNFVPLVFVGFIDSLFLLFLTYANNDVRNGVNKHEETCCQTQSKHNEHARCDPLYDLPCSGDNQEKNS